MAGRSHIPFIPTRTSANNPQDSFNVRTMSFPTASLPSTILFGHISEHLTVGERINISHERAKAIAACYSLTIDDVLRPSQRFWDMYRDYIVTLDGAAVALFSIQLNLAAGTLAPFIESRPELKTLMDDILSFRISAQFLLTELGHGLNALHLETTATMQNDGSFIVDTPNPQAAKYMAPTLPFGGVPRVGILMARLMVRGEDRGIRPFIVSLNDGKTMCTGVTARELPSRLGCKSFGHALTYFDHVKIPSSALLGTIENTSDARSQFIETIWRVAIGSMSMSAMVSPALKMASYIAATYSKRRLVVGPRNQTIPILSFRTQQLPILHALAQGYVLDALYQQAITWLSEISVEDINQRNAIATIVKATMIGHWRRTGCSIADRCGAQGMFECNQILPMEMELRGVAIAEGDVLALALRLAPELLLKRYTIPAGQKQDSLLNQHEQKLGEEMSAIIAASQQRHRGDDVNRLLLPRCLQFVDAIGHRMAWEAAITQGLPEPLIRLYEISAVGIDLAWYVEKRLFSRDDFFRQEDEALSTVYSHLQEYLDAMDIAPYAVAAITSDSSWKNFSDSLKVYEGNADYAPFSETTARARL